MLFHWRDRFQVRHVAVMLHACLRNGWLVAMHDALKRWVYFFARQDGGVALPWGTRQHESTRRADGYSRAGDVPSSPPLLPIKYAAGAMAGGGSPEGAVSPLARQAQMQLVEARRQLHTSREAAAMIGGGASVNASTVAADGTKFFGDVAATASARRLAKLLEVTRVVWLSPLGGGSALRALWHWAVVTGVEARKGLLEETRRVRAERDGATEREKQLKRGLASIREDKASVDAEAAKLKEEVQKLSGSPSEEQALRRMLQAAQAERDGLARALKEARETMHARRDDEERDGERERAEKRALALAHKERQGLLRELSEVKTERKEMAAREAAALERARTHRQQLEKMRAERDAALDKAQQAVNGVSEAAKATAAAFVQKGDLVTLDESRMRARRVAGAARVDHFLRGRCVYHLTGHALRKWALVALGRPAGIDKDEAHGLMGQYRDSRRMAKQLSAAREEVAEKAAAQQAAETRLKAERRQTAAARGDRDSQTTALTSAREEAAEAKRKEEAAKAALASAKREINELRKAMASVQQERTLGEFERGSVAHQHVERVSQQRNIALQEVGALAQELESLQVALASPQREQRDRRGSSTGYAPSATHMAPPPPYPPQPHRQPPTSHSPARPSPLAAAAYSRGLPPSTGGGGGFPSAASNYYASPGRYATQGGPPPSTAAALAQQYAERGPPIHAVSPTPRPGASAVARPAWG